MLILTPEGYKPIGAVKAGDEVHAFDAVTGALIINRIEKKEWFSRERYNRSWGLEERPNSGRRRRRTHRQKAPEIPWESYVVNGRYHINADQSVWSAAVPDSAMRCVHGRDLRLGHFLFDDIDGAILITSLEHEQADGWWRFDISGDHSLGGDLRRCQQSRSRQRANSGGPHRYDEGKRDGRCSYGCGHSR